MLPLLLSVFLGLGDVTRTALLHESAPSPLGVELILASGTDLPVATHAITAEVGRIWSHTGVDLRWSHGRAADDSRAGRVILVIVSDVQPDGWRVPHRALGGVPMVAGHLRQIIYVAPSRVRRLVVSTGAQPRDPHFERLYARMLGRVIAHELGHLLLRSGEHRDDGLMRESFEKQDVLSSAHDRFAVSSADVAAIRGHADDTRLATLWPAVSAIAVRRDR